MNPAHRLASAAPPACLLLLLATLGCVAQALPPC